MADENSVYNITEHDSTRTYSKDDIVVVFRDVGLDFGSFNL